MPVSNEKEPTMQSRLRLFDDPGSKAWAGEQQAAARVGCGLLVTIHSATSRSHDPV